MIAATQGKEHFAWVTGPLGERVKACWGMSGDGVTAFIEMAAASGLGLVPPDKRNPLITTSRGYRGANITGAGAWCGTDHYRHRR
ncbi:glycerate kinase [Klebsiella pneumoniae subsp. pneumoniae]|nr:glycerate kinase [Klebsiella pneumoniae subsp. pneumoniae]